MPGGLLWTDRRFLGYPWNNTALIAKTGPPGSDGAGLAGTLESFQGSFEHFLVNQFLQRAVESLARLSSKCEFSMLDSSSWLTSATALTIGSVRVSDSGCLLLGIFHLPWLQISTCYPGSLVFNKLLQADHSFSRCHEITPTYSPRVPTEVSTSLVPPSRS